MHFKWLRKHDNRTSDGGDTKEVAPETTAHAATREPEFGPPSSQALRYHYQVLLNIQSTKIASDFNGRVKSSGNYFQYTLVYQGSIRRCCNIVSFCLLEEWLIRRRQHHPSSPPSSGFSEESGRHHVDRARRRLCKELVKIALFAVLYRDFQRPEQSLAKCFVATAVSATALAALDAETALGFESSTMALSHSLLVVAHRTAEYVAQCHIQGKKPSWKGARALLLPSESWISEVPRESRSSSVLASDSDTLLGSPEAAPEATASGNPFLERPETPSSCSSPRSSYSMESETAGNRSEDCASLIGRPSNTPEAAMLCRGKRASDSGVRHGRA
ncbi:hypothetical protein PG988_011483 [Apiospora saccharicola]